MVFDNWLCSGNVRKVFIKNYITQAQIGVYESEKGREQKVRFNIEVYVRKTAHAPITLAEVFNYEKVVTAVEKVLAQGHIDLQETAVHQIGMLLMQEEEILGAKVRSEKLEVYPNAESVGVEEVFLKGVEPQDIEPKGVDLGSSEQ